MANKNAPHDDNYVPTALFAISTATNFVAPGQIDQITGRILVDASGGGIASDFQTDVFTSSNNQTIFTATKTVAYTLGFYVNGSLQTPSTDYSVSSSVATLANGIPSGNIVVWVYSIN